MTIKKIISLLFIFLSLIYFGCSATTYEMGRDALDEGNYKLAVEYLTNEVSAFPDNKDAWRDLGIAELKQKKYIKAEENLNKAFDIDSRDAETIFYLGLLNEYKDDLDKATIYYTMYTDLDNINSDFAELIKGRIKIISRKKIENEVKELLMNENLVEDKTPEGNTLAVLYFKNIGDKKELDPLQKGLAQMMITDLSQVKSIKIVERLRLQALIDEMKLSSSSLFDQQSSPRFGRLLKANTLIKGTYLNTGSEDLRIDAGLINVSDGTLQQSDEVSGNLQEFFKLEKDLVFKVLDKLGITPSNEERAAIQTIPTESLFAFLRYCHGLDLEDQRKYPEALEQFDIAFDTDPSFGMAKTKRNEIQNIIDANDIDEIQEKISFKEKKTLGRLFESYSNLTEELYTGQDDRSPFSEGKKVKVTIQVK